MNAYIHCAASALISTPFGIFENLRGESVTPERMLRFNALKFGTIVLACVFRKMFIFSAKTLTAALLLAFICSVTMAAQAVGSIPYKSQDVAADGVPVLIKHLPEWETVRDRATLANSVDELKSALGDRAILDAVEFPGGTEAVTVQYEAGKLLMVEYATPQASIDADAAITSKLAAINDALTVYRRIGNYNAFVFDATNQTAANALLDQIKYEKTVHWLGKNPYIISAERAFVIGTADLFLSTLLVIVIGIGFSVLCGLILGFVFFNIREHKRANMPTFSDAGGMTRLNLDGFTPDILPERLLNE